MKGKSDIITIIMVFLEKIDKSLDCFLGNADLLSGIIEIEIDLLKTTEILTPWYTTYLIENFLLLLNIYTEKFLEDLFLMLCIKGKYDKEKGEKPIYYYDERSKISKMLEEFAWIFAERLEEILHNYP